MRSSEEVERVLGLVAIGRNDCEITRATGIPRTTVWEWRHAPPNRANQKRRDQPGRWNGECDDEHDLARVSAVPYAYLLGLYLGDGCISRHPRTYRLRFSLDAAYPGIIGHCVTALEVLRPGKRASTYRTDTSRCVEVSMYWQHWPCLFPQHGPGKKHLRPIRLEPWQGAIVVRKPHLFVRGLIHSDGCRVVANDRGRPSVRYHFSNLSGDIKRLYCLGLQLLGVQWTRPCERQIAVYRKESVAILDRLVGPKS